MVQNLRSEDQSESRQKARSMAGLREKTRVLRKGGKTS